MRCVFVLVYHEAILQSFHENPRLSSLTCLTFLTSHNEMTVDEFLLYARGITEQASHDPEARDLTNAW